MKWGDWFFITLFAFVIGALIGGQSDKDQNCISEEYCAGEVKKSYDFGYFHGMSYANRQNLNGSCVYNECPWDKWTPEEQNCLQIMNGENRYETAWTVCEGKRSEDYLKIKEILKGEVKWKQSC